jgi:hypothetical protein
MIIWSSEAVRLLDRSDSVDEIEDGPVFWLKCLGSVHTFQLSDGRRSLIETFLWGTVTESLMCRTVLQTRFLRDATKCSGS